VPHPRISMTGASDPLGPTRTPPAGRFYTCGHQPARPYIREARRVGRGRRSMTEIELSASAINAIASRVVEMLESRPAPSVLIDAAEVARRLGVTRGWVYEHASELGALRLGDGECPRLRFDPERVTSALAIRHAPPPQVSEPARTRSRPHRPNHDVPLLPVCRGL
jgi:hypothetical protein